MAIKFILFDFDGVLLDTEPLHFMTRRKIAREQFDSDYVVDLNAIVGGSAVDSYARLLEHFGKEGDPQALSDLHYSSLAEYICETCAVASAELLQLLDGLDARGIGYGICSSSPGFYVDPILEAMGLSERFQFYCGGDEVANLKPAPDLYLLGIERSGFAAEEILAIEDSKTGMRAAHAAGLVCVGFQPEGNEQDLTAADRLITKLPEMLGYIDTL